MLSFQRALVTGGAGFIGSHLCRRLTEAGVEVTAVDRLAPGDETGQPDGPSFRLADIREDALAEVFRQARPEAVFHLAAQTSVIKSEEDPAEDASVNVLGSLNVLQNCRRFGARALVYTSSGGTVYGDPSRLPCVETDPIQPVSPYGASKYAAEVYVHCQCAMAGIGYSVLRLANVYGPGQPRQNEGGVITRFGRQMLRGEPVTIYGDGLQQRDFVYVDDVTSALITAAEKPANEVYNIGSGGCASVLDIFRTLAQLTGYQQEPRYEEQRAGEVYKSWLDVAKAREGLGWRPKTDLATGIALTLESLR